MYASAAMVSSHQGLKGRHVACRLRGSKPTGKCARHPFGVVSGVRAVLANVDGIDAEDAVFGLGLWGLDYEWREVRLSMPSDTWLGALQAAGAVRLLIDCCGRDRSGSPAIGPVSVRWRNGQARRALGAVHPRLSRVLPCAGPRRVHTQATAKAAARPKSGRSRPRVREPSPAQAQGQTGMLVSAPTPAGVS